MNKLAISVIAILALTSVVVYKTLETEQDYSERLKRIARSINSQNLSWKAENPSRFAEMTKSQVMHLMGTKIKENSEHVLNADILEVPEDATVPDSFSSAATWPKCTSITEIRDQSHCGSCWAFGSTEAMSDRICITSGQVQQTKLSADDVMSCCSSCGDGCNGGDPYAAWAYFRNTGVVTGDLYGTTTTCKPYPLAPCAHHVTPKKYPACPQNDARTPACQRQCIPQYKKSYKSDRHFGKTYYGVNGEKAMKFDISQKGPITVSFAVYEDFLTYKSGVYYHQQGQLLGFHSVRIVGYGNEDGMDYWNVANSWNDQWGDNGYFKIKRGVDECGIESQGVAGDV